MQENPKRTKIERRWGKRGEEASKRDHEHAGKKKRSVREDHAESME
jgi:hypothetical protein